MKTIALLAVVGYAVSTSAFTINFVNRCGFSESVSLCTEV